ncbi:putative epsilon-adaptin, putative,AP-1/4 adapter complex gamma/epsilon subunit [Trypanosoma theileri]|uniref:AP-4 complex subunit epsilon n=1 Tax=Trypanosoma theileri TaxID=67003 RepID=A0A1X0P1U8_9TRYP|nr:putative epsilon-adaptin, putative,AP-1/4 adapter complex gamma/epsilon subunit [Trypanosoma theileri]ORC90916.1 putative epsilon-adaptin, putative,AP-1/4 adapter complex gamma/epsilon subunit [Trypanosoma theileri]
MSKLYKAQTQQGHSRGFFEYIRSIGESKSKQEEDEIVVRDLADLKKSLAAKNIDKRLLKEYVVRTFYAEMLGHSAEFAHIQCVNLSSSPDLLFKRTGYLGTWLTVGPEHELMYLIVSNLQRDMKSTNFLDIAAALTAARKMLRPELMTAINAEVVSLLNHPNALVRKKVIQTMQAFYRKSDGLIGDCKLFRRALCDQDPSVMGAALHLFSDVIYADPVSQRDLIPIFKSILRQITENRLSRDYDYHRIPAPWFQMKILKILSMLIGDDQLLANECEDILTEVIKRSDNGLSIGYAVTCEAISAITRIPTIPSLIQLAAEALAKFLSGTNANMRYVGIQALSQIVLVDAKYAREHQQVVMACLEDADETIRRKTMLLLLAMCNEDNIDTILSRLVKSLSQTKDKYVRQDLTRRICDAAERFSPGAIWYIETMNKVLLCAAEHVPQTTIQGILKLIAEGETDDVTQDTALRVFCVENYFDLLESTEKKLPEAFCRVAAWVIGEYGFLTKRVSRTMLLDRLCDMLERAESVSTREWILMAMMKIVAHVGYLPDNVEELVERFKSSRGVGLQQRCYEFTELVKMPVLMKKVLPLDGCCENIEVDESMGFLNNIVEEALLAGAKPYEKRTLRFGVKEEETLRTDAYKAQRADIVDESELDPEKFNTEEPHKLFIRPNIRRWGVKNLEEETAAGAAGVVETAGREEEKSLMRSTEEISTSMGKTEHLSDGTVLHYVDPLMPSQREHVKPSKNEKFLNDIFGGSSKKKTITRRQVDMTELTLSSAKTLEVNNEPILTVKMEQVRETTAMGIIIRIIGKTTVQNITIHIKPPLNCTLRMMESSIPISTVNGNMFTLEKLQSHQPLNLSLHLLPIAFPSEGTVQVEVTYRSSSSSSNNNNNSDNNNNMMMMGSNDTQRISASIPVRLYDLLRPPLQMTTQQFGEIWLQLKEECKVQLTSPLTFTPELLRQLLLERASLRVVEVIRNEIIAAALLLGTSTPLLCHVAVVGPNAANVTVRAEDKSFAALGARAISAS